jgi:hypothetical protein
MFSAVNWVVWLPVPIVLRAIKNAGTTAPIVIAHSIAPTRKEASGSCDAGLDSRERWYFPPRPNTDYPTPVRHIGGGVVSRAAV